MIIDSLVTVIAINLPRHKCASLAWGKKYIYMLKAPDEGHHSTKMEFLKVQCYALRERKMWRECKVAKMLLFIVKKEI